MGIFWFLANSKRGEDHRNLFVFLSVAAVFALLLTGLSSQVYAQIEGDFDGDSDVDLLDLTHFASQWLNPCGDPNWCEGADFDHSDRVDFLDFAALAGNWGLGNPPAQPDNFSLVSSNKYPTRMAIGPDEKIYVTDFETGSVFVYESDLNDPNSKDLVG